MRGNARQVYEKYLTLARDASSAGDRIAAEAYYQHAEHYFRILNDSTDPQAQRRHEERQPQANGHAEAYGADADEDQPGIANGRAFQAEERAPGQGNGAAAPVDAQPEAKAAAGGGEAVNGEEAAPRPRRGRPRKPRTSEGDKAAKTEAAAEAEDGPAVG